MVSVGDKVELKKKHPCGGYVWTVVRVGADFKIKCDVCGKTIMLTSDEFKKRVKNNV